MGSPRHPGQFRLRDNLRAITQISRPHQPDCYITPPAAPRRGAHFHPHGRSARRPGCFVSLLALGSSRGWSVRARPDKYLDFQRSRAEGSACETSARTCAERGSTRRKSSTEAAGVPLTDCFWAFVFSVDGAVRDASLKSGRPGETVLHGLANRVRTCESLGVAVPLFEVIQKFGAYSERCYFCRRASSGVCSYVFHGR
jgi:hypothetical protein